MPSAGKVRMRRSVGISLAATGLLCGCSEGLFAPRGPVAEALQTILVNSLGIMLAIVIPTILATLGVAWWYRASHQRARYQPDWEYSGRIEMIVWSIPAMTIMLLGGLCWIGSHDLDPATPLASPVKPLRVQAVALDWKWLFIYPDQGVASVNRLVIPAATPIRFQLTSAGVMNDFWVPQLGSQIYAMSGMVTTLHLQADKPGSFPGRAAQFNGDGFADMVFVVDAVPADRFDQAMAAVRGAGPTLDAKSYAELVKPGVPEKPFTYGSVAPDMFATILRIATASPTTENRAKSAKEE